MAETGKSEAHETGKQMMISVRKTKFFVATGILVCLVGLTFIAMSGNSALSEGYGTGFEMPSLSLWHGDQSGQCIAVKGAQTCAPVDLALN
ncbi:hypothetical protein [Cohaesibacter haloalkalitolerans]|uniref:hypothetical protein n=1 Tax=Cohaesibacter haloalkalitolerans TaxID=1162980 RepID=UPI0013C4C763|nr:hypothetical protein [Cohaesibacter haloalkalitolerans]